MENAPVAVIASQFPKVVIPLLDAAQHSVCIVVFDWRWYPTRDGSSVSQFNAAIARAAQRGVEVRCLVNNDGVIARLASVGCKARRLHSKKMLHTKMLLIDSVQLVIGSHNYTHHGFALNEEASVLVNMADSDNDFVRYFNALWGV